MRLRLGGQIVSTVCYPCLALPYSLVAIIVGADTDARATKAKIVP